MNKGLLKARYSEIGVPTNFSQLTERELAVWQFIWHWKKDLSQVMYDPEYVPEKAPTERKRGINDHVADALFDMLQSKAAAKALEIKPGRRADDEAQFYLALAVTEAIELGDNKLWPASDLISEWCGCSPTTAREAYLRYRDHIMRWEIKLMKPPRDAPWEPFQRTG